ncbi:TPA: hypothetical protein DDZ86_01255 [Candidatus Dependentiae bacterium]|nr:MAG: hypothetical protein UW09_C0004G0132 [candidate division TM6 bacterium GW2011_GWF2_43_87]HBL98254.1 hypothetical protein [Candidatus Dependentiae bacterium]
MKLKILALYLSSLCLVGRALGDELNNLAQSLATIAKGTYPSDFNTWKPKQKALWESLSEPERVGLIKSPYPQGYNSWDTNEKNAWNLLTLQERLELIKFPCVQFPSGGGRGRGGFWRGRGRGGFLGHDGMPKHWTQEQKDLFTAWSPNQKAAWNSFNMDAQGRWKGREKRKTMRNCP